MIQRMPSVSGPGSSLCVSMCIDVLFHLRIAFAKGAECGTKLFARSPDGGRGLLGSRLLQLCCSLRTPGHTRFDSMVAQNHEGSLISTAR